MLIPRSFPAAWLILLVFAAGCGGKREPTPSATESTPENNQEISADASATLATARRALESGNVELAAEIAQRRLLTDPDDRDAILIAAQVEAAQGNHAQAAEFAESIDIADDRLGIKAAILRAEQATLAGDHATAAAVLTQLANRFPTEPRWQHLLWDSLNQQARRQDASTVASALMRSGNANLQELQSLIRRGHAFPTRLPDGKQPEDQFATNVALARWLFTKEDFPGALKALEAEQQRGFKRADVIALYGRLLAETQTFERMADWHIACTDEVKNFGDYWAAIGTFFMNGQQYEAATRAFLEAVVRNPTDRSSYQRLGRSLGSLGRAMDSKQAYLRGILISDSEALLQNHLDNPADPDIHQQLSEKLLELGRPFEMLQWMARSLPPGAASQRALIDSQRQKMLRLPDLEQMTRGEATIELNPGDFDYEKTRDQTLRPSSPTNAVANIERTGPLANPKLSDVAKQVGLDFQWFHDVEIDLSSVALYESVGGGGGVIDYDLDGWPDIYLAQGAAGPPLFQATKSNELLRNFEGQFRSATNPSGVGDLNYSVGIAVGDVNQDGFPDIFLGNLGANRLFINNGDGTFADASDRLGKHTARFTTSVAIADLDGDALPDLFECNYIELEGVVRSPKLEPSGKETHVGPLGHFAEADRCFRASADGRFEIIEIGTDVAELGTALGVVVTNFDSKPGNETFVANDARANHFLQQVAEREFVNQADARGLAYGFHGSPNACMGVATGDFNRDGAIDIHVANFLGEANDLYLQTEAGGFVDASTRFGLAKLTRPFLGFGSKAIDIDRNGWLDLVITNGHIRDNRDNGDPFQMPPLFLMHHGNQFVVGDVEDTSGYWNGEHLGRAIALLDFDRDHSIDFLVTHLDHPTALLRNETVTPGHWIQLELIGTTSERDAVGATVNVTASGTRFTEWVTAGDGYLCSDEAVLDIGLGTAERIERLEVVWPTGKRQLWNDLEVDHRYLLIEDEPQAMQRSDRG